MSVIELDRQTKLDLSVFEHVWLGLHPERNPRVRVKIGDKQAAYPISAEIRTRSGSMFDQPSGGESLIDFTLNEKKHVLPGDTVMLWFYWI